MMPEYDTIVCAAQCLMSLPRGWDEKCDIWSSIVLAFIQMILFKQTSCTQRTVVRMQGNVGYLLNKLFGLLDMT